MVVLLRLALGVLLALGMVPGLPGIDHPGIEAPQVGSSTPAVGREPLIVAPGEAGEAPPRAELLITDLVAALAVRPPARSLQSPAQRRTQPEHPSLVGDLPHPAGAPIGQLTAAAPSALSLVELVGHPWLHSQRAPPA